MYIGKLCRLEIVDWSICSIHPTAKLWNSSQTRYNKLTFLFTTILYLVLFRHHCDFYRSEKKNWMKLRRNRSFVNDKRRTDYTWNFFLFYLITKFTIETYILSVYIEYKYLERYPHFHVFSSSQFKFPLHSTERPRKSPDVFTAFAFAKCITRYISCGTFWRTKKRTSFCAINIFTIVCASTNEGHVRIFN